MPSKSRTSSILAALTGLALAFSAAPTEAAIAIVRSAKYTIPFKTTPGPYVQSFNAVGVNKIVVTVASENANGGNNHGITGVKFNGVSMTSAVNQNGPLQGGVIIYYLDSPAQVTANVEVLVSGQNGGLAIIAGLSGTAAGKGATATATPAKTLTSVPISITTTADNSMVIACFMSDGESAAVPTCTSPLTAIQAGGRWGTNWGSHIAGSKLEATTGLKTYNFGTNVATVYDFHVAAVEFKEASDTTPPTITTYNPVSGAINVAVGANLVATFSENIAIGTGDILIKNLTDATTTTITLPNAQVTVSGAVLMIDPSVDFLPDKAYAIQIAAGAVKDLATVPNDFAGIADDTTWNFASTETTPPTLAAASIVDDKGGASILQNTLVTYAVTFSEDMDALTVTAADFVNAGTSTVIIGAPTETSPGVFSVPVTPTTAGTLQLQLVSGADVKDVAGNSLVTTPVTDDTTLTVVDSLVYWDIDGNLVGAGGSTPIGTWLGANTLWNTVADGTGTTGAWFPGQTAVFAAGTDAIGIYDVTVSGSNDISGLTFEEGTVTLTGGTELRLVANAPVDVAAGLSAIVATPITQDASARSLTKTGDGTLTLSGQSATPANNYAGTTIIGAGALAISANDPSFTGGLTFGSANASPTLGALNLSSSSTTYAGLALVRTNNATANTISIAATRSLTLNGGLTLGYDAAGGTGATNSNLTVSGAGSLAIAGTTVAISVNQAAQNAGYHSRGTLDVAGLAAFSTNVTNFNIGVGTTTTGVGNVLLSDTANTIITTGLKVGDTGGNNGNGTSTLTLGTGSNGIQADTIEIGKGKGAGSVKFASQAAASPGTVTIANKLGTGAANITIANVNGVGTAGGSGGALDLRGHDATVNAGTLIIAQTNANSNVSTTNGSLSFDAGAITVATLNMARKTGSSTGTATATLNVGGGTFTVNTAFTLGSQAGNGASVATLNLTGGTLSSAASILDGGGNSTSKITLDGGILNLNGNAIGGATAINTLEFKAGELQNVAQINNGVGAFTKTTAGTLLVSGTSTYTNDTTVSEGILTLSYSVGAPNANIGNDGSTVTIAATGATLNLTFSGTDVVDKLFIGGVQQVAGTYGPTGTFNIPQITNSTGNGTLTVTSSPPANTYANWIDSFFTGVTDPLIIGAAADPDKDCIPNGVEMVIGGDPELGMDSALLPTIELVNADPDGDTTSSDYLLFTYRRTAISELALVVASCETDTDLLAPWTAAINGASGVVIQEDLNYLLFTPAAPANTDRVRVYVPRGANIKLFGRLNVVVP